MVQNNEGYPLISVAMATYNGEAFLEQQLDSIYGQTYPNLEVVVCDDASQDNTAAILKRYQEEKGLRLFLNEKRLGFMKNFEKALTLCQGQYIALSDQDDVWYEDKIEYLYNHIEDNLLIHGDYAAINHQNQMISRSIRKETFKKHYKRIYLDNINHHKYVMTQSHLCTGCTFLMHRDLLRLALPIPAFESFHDDWLSHVAASQRRIKYVDKILIAWRAHGKNSSLNKYNKLFKKIHIAGTLTHHLYRRYRYYLEIPKILSKKKSLYCKLLTEVNHRGYRIENYPFNFFQDLWFICISYYDEPQALDQYR